MTLNKLTGHAIRSPRFKDLVLGFDSADFEATHHPDLLLEGFVDHLGLANEAKYGHKFLFLGYKGSGKSALGEHLRLGAANDPLLFVEFVNIDDVSFSTFSQILKGSIEPEARYPMVWSWLLLIFLLNSFSRDEGSNFAQDDELFLTVEALKQLGLLPEPSLSRAVNATSERSFSLKLNSVIGGIEGTYKTTTGTPDLPFFVERLKLVSRRFRSKSRHLLIIDGFDELLRRGHLQYDALGALIFEANRLNLHFAEAGNSAKIVVLCRTDLFEHFPGPNKNKIRQNSAVQLDWYGDPYHPEQSSLVQLINHRAGLSAGEAVDVFAQYLPEKLSNYKDEGIHAELLANTRCVPRDIVNLFAKLQEYSGDERMTVGQVFSALAAYSKDYFLPEITDEMDGYVSTEHIELTKRLLATVGKINPQIYELKDQAAALGYPSSFDLSKVLNVLFECSAIGNVIKAKRGKSFKYENRHASFKESDGMIIHRGLWKALGLNW
jgi:hypothetical protein